MPWRLPAAALALFITLLCRPDAARAEPDAGPTPDTTSDTNAGDTNVGDAATHDTSGTSPVDAVLDTSDTSGTSDTGPVDAVPDTSDTSGTSDTGPFDAVLGTSDTSDTSDTGPVDAVLGTSDTSDTDPSDTGPSDTGSADADTLDTSDTGPSDSDALDAQTQPDLRGEDSDAQGEHGGARPGAVHPKVPPPRGPPGATLSTGDAIKAIFGLVLLMALAWLGGHPKVQKLEQKLRISQVITAGFPFVLIGLVSREGGLGILSQPVLDAIRPLLPLGLGWIGFAVGFRFDVRRLDGMPKLTAETFVATTALPYLFIVGAVAALFYLTGDSHDPLVIIRDATILATAGAMTAVSLPRFLARQGTEPSAVDRITCIIQLEELAALLGVILIGAFFRPDQADLGWRLPSVGWVFVTLGIGTALSGVIFAILGTIKGPAETLVVMLGSICFAAGMASFLRLSPVVVCFIAGAVLQNFPGPWKAQVRDALARIERPVYLLFLVIAGALWRVDEWQGWVLMLVFVLARLVGRQGGVYFFARRHPGLLSAVEQRHLAISPMGALSLAIIVTAQDLYSGPTVPWMVNAVIGGAILTEVVVQTLAFGGERARTRGAARMTRTFFPAYVDPPPRPDGDPVDPAPEEEPR